MAWPIVAGQSNISNDQHSGSLSAKFLKVNNWFFLVGSGSGGGVGVVG